MAFVAAVIAIVLTPLFVLADDLFFDFAAWLPSIPPLVSSGLLPVAIFLAVLGGFYALMKRKYTATRNETVQAVFVLLLFAFIILTITTVWFRGEGMALTWPWNI
jgi:uncharacterized membrane protein